jgi:hypothetical protein
MASNVPSSRWSVKIISLPTSITINTLAETFQLPTSRICVPKIQKTITYFAWINDFVSEKDAKDFVNQWSDSSVFDTVIKCYVQGPESDKVYVHHTRDNGSISHATTHPDKTADTQLEFDFSNEFKETRSSCSSSNSSVPSLIFETTGPSNTRRPFNQNAESNPVLPRPQRPSKFLYINTQF